MTESIIQLFVPFEPSPLHNIVQKAEFVNFVSFALENLMSGGMSSSSFFMLLLLLILVLTHSLEADSKSRCRKSERDALVKFKQGLVDPSNRLISWVGEDCCLWHGVGCSNTSGHVVELNLQTRFDETGSNQRIGGKTGNSLINLTYLNYLDLSNNNFSGRIPDSLGQFQRLEYLYLKSNFFWGPIPESIGRMSQLRVLCLSNNQLNASIPASIGKLSNLELLDLSTNLLEGSIPQSLGKLSKLWQLEIGNNLLNDIVSEYYFHMFVGVLILDISNNLLSGPIPSTIGNIMPGLIFLSLSNNQLNGSIPTSLCIMGLNYLDLSMNRLSGRIPECWNKTPMLFVLDLANNNLSGPIPASLGSIFFLVSLHLEKNNLHGEVPASLGNQIHLLTLDLSQNAFVGSISPWISDRWVSLQILSIHSNKFNGEIPPKLCHLSSLRILNLANNKMTGTIPPCFQNFTPMVADNSTYASSWLSPMIYPVNDFPAPNNLYLPYQEHVLSYMKGRELKYDKTILELLYSLDLSENNFFGEIPIELMKLSMLQSLNLSGNNLTGNIPSNIGKLRSLESLDFSRNDLSGSIPPSISELNFLSYLNLSFNNLSGIIPHGNQLQTLDDKSIYIGNAGLCGPPLGICKPPDATVESDGDGSKFEMIWFYCGLSMGFFSGFVGICGVLYFCGSWRYACFQLADKIYNDLWVIVAIKTNLIRRKLGGQD